MTTPRRRWSFSLRTLFVAVAALSLLLALLAHVVHERQIVQSRRNAWNWARTIGAFGPRPQVFTAMAFTYPPILPARPKEQSFRRFFGDRSIAGETLVFPNGTSEAKVDEMQRLFPEASMTIVSNPYFEGAGLYFEGAGAALGLWPP